MEYDPKLSLEQRREVDRAYAMAVGRLPKPSAAQPIDPPSSGNPYAILLGPSKQQIYQPPATQAPLAMPAYSKPAAPVSFVKPSVAAPRPSNTAFTEAWNNRPLQKGETRTPAYTIGGEGPGNLAYMPEGYRPAPFEAQYQQLDGSYSDKPNYDTRMAFVNAINEHDAKYALGLLQGPKQYNFGELYGQANQMVEQGWTNPLAGLFGGDITPEAYAQMLAGGPAPEVPRGGVW